MDLPTIEAEVDAFSRERDWAQFHSPKNLVMALAGEVGELSAEFQWLTIEESDRVMEDAVRADGVRDEIADVFIYLVRLASVLGLSLEEVARAKLAKNAARYPVSKASGRRDKYDRL